MAEDSLAGTEGHKVHYTSQSEYYTAESIISSDRPYTGHYVQPEKEDTLRKHLKSKKQRNQSTILERYGKISPVDYTSYGYDLVDHTTGSEQRNSDHQQITKLSKAVGLVYLTGQLATTNIDQIYQEARDEMRLAKKEGRLAYNRMSIFQYLDRRNQMPVPGESAEITALKVFGGAMMFLIVTHDDDLYHDKLKQLQKVIPRENMNHSEIVESIFCYDMVHSLLGKYKTGKALKYLEQAKSSLQHFQPNVWTANLFEREAVILIVRGYQIPRLRKHLLEKACYCFKRGMDDTERDSNNHDPEWIASRYVYFLMHMMYVTLDMPVPTITNITDVKYWRTINSQIEGHYFSYCMLKDAEGMFKKAEKIMPKLIKENEDKSFAEWAFALGKIYLNLRKMQWCVYNEEYHHALSLYFATKALHEDFLKDYSYYAKYIIKCIGITISEIHDQVRPQVPFVPEAEKQLDTEPDLTNTDDHVNILEDIIDEEGVSVSEE